MDGIGDWWLADLFYDLFQSNRYTEVKDNSRKQCGNDGPQQIGEIIF